MNAVLPFEAYFLGDGSKVSFSLDFAKDPVFFSNSIALAAGDNFPTPELEFLNRGFDPRQSYPTAFDTTRFRVAANDANLGAPTISISGSIVTFTLASAPGAGLIIVQGFVQF